MWPHISNPKTGEISVWEWTNSGWTQSIGFVQSEIPAVAVAKCPNLPVAGKVNEKQTSTKFSEIAKAARPIKNFRVSFANDNRNPLTVEMLYWAYPPN